MAATAQEETEVVAMVVGPMVVVSLAEAVRAPVLTVVECLGARAVALVVVVHTRPNLQQIANCVRCSYLRRRSSP